MICFCCSFYMLLLTFLLALVSPSMAASFYGASFISLPLEDSKVTTELSLRFRSSQADALIFLATGPKDYCLLSLEAGNMKVKINLGAGEEEISGPSGLKLNDLMWHEIHLERDSSDLVLTIDRFHTVERTLSGQFLALNINYGIYLGGTGNFSKFFLGNYQNFRGCIEKVSFNGLDVIERAIQVQSALKDITFDCSTQFQASSMDAISFLGEGSFISLPNLGDSRKGGSLEFKIKTASSTGVLFYITSTGVFSQDFLAVELIGGKVQVSANDGSAAIVLQSDVTVTTGFWHQVTINFRPDQYVISVDGKSRESRVSVGEKRSFDFKSDLYVGGMEASMLHYASIQGLRSLFEGEMDISFKGCLQSIKFNGVLMGLEQVLVSKHIESGCIWRFPCLLSEPCTPGAECFQEGFSSFRCFCDFGDCVRGNFTSIGDQKHPHRFQFSGDSSEIPLITVVPLSIFTGCSHGITSKHIQIPSELGKYHVEDNSIIYIVSTAQHGVIQIDRFSSQLRAPDNAFLYSELDHGGIRYIHDGKSAVNDSIVFRIEFISRTYRLPNFLDGRSKTFTLPVKVASLDDMSTLHDELSTLSISRSTVKKVPLESSISNGSEAFKNKQAPQEFKYLNIIITGSHLLIAMCILTSVGLCVLLTMLKVLLSHKNRSQKGLASTATEHLKQNFSGGGLHENQETCGSEIMIDDSGRGSLPYDRASTISELAPYFGNINCPSTSANCSIRSTSDTPVSSFGRGMRKHAMICNPCSHSSLSAPTGTLKTRFDSAASPTADELFPLPPPILYFGESHHEDTKYSLPRLYSFQPGLTSSGTLRSKNSEQSLLPKISPQEMFYEPTSQNPMVDLPYPTPLSFIEPSRSVAFESSANRENIDHSRFSPKETTNHSANALSSFLPLKLPEAPESYDKYWI